MIDLVVIGMSHWQDDSSLATTTRLARIHALEFRNDGIGSLVWQNRMCKKDIVAAFGDAKDG
jgi:hypothetical protein